MARCRSIKIMWLPTSINGKLCNPRIKEHKRRKQHALAVTRWCGGGAVAQCFSIKTMLLRKFERELCNLRIRKRQRRKHQALKCNVLKIFF